MTRLLDHAIALAQAILGANTAANLWECVGGLTDFIGLAQPPLSGQAQPIWDIVVQRAMGLAIWHATLAAPARLLCGLGLRKFRINLAEIISPI